MPDIFLKANIKISAVEDTGVQIKVKDENKKTYSFFKNKKDGAMTKAFEQWGHYKVGDTTGISYKEVPYKDGTIRNITTFNPVFEQIGAPAPQTPKIFQSTNGKIEELKDNTFWDKKAYKQCLWNFWLEQQTGGLNPDWKEIVWNVFNNINEDAEKRFAIDMGKAKQIFDTEEPPLEDTIPF